MNRRHFLSMPGAAAIAAAIKVRPNFVFILADDLGWRDFACYGNRLHQTPNIDAAAREGLRFTDAYAACPVCSPTRASVLTGKTPGLLHLTDWIPGRKRHPTSPIVTPDFEQQLPLKEVTLAEALKPLGYRTASIGKWHLGGQGFLPTDQGFDVNVGGDQRGSTPSYFGPWNTPNMPPSTKDDYITEVLTSEAEKFIEQSAKQPFFLYLPHFAVHTPLQARPAAIDKYKTRIGDKDFPNATYAAMVEAFDTSVGRIRNTLARLGLKDNTVLVIFSDNGGLRYEGKSKHAVTDNAPLRAGKGHLYEGGIREPLIMCGPGVTRKGQTESTPVASIDFFPTLLEMAGATRPAAGSIEGISFAPLLKGGPAPKRDALYWHYPHYSNQGGAPGGAIRSGDWKLIEFYEDSRLELYNVKDDIGETRNLVLLEPAIAKKLQARLAAWRKQVNASMPVKNPGYDPATADQGLTGQEKPTPPAKLKAG
jgi:arylsulfatase A-like enzyme